MSDLAEAELGHSPARRWAARAGIAAAVLAALALLAWLISGVGTSSPSGPKRQVAKIAILPDTPPPPPPPPKEDTPPPPKEAPKQALQTEAPKAEAPPEPTESLKMEGPAGDGPSAFSAGAVTQDYQGGAVISGGNANASGADRSRFMFYANSARQMLRGELDKQLDREVLRLGARLRIWVAPGGGIERYEIAQIGNPAFEDELRAALDRAARGYRLPPPPGLPQPLELQLSVRPAGG
ncbi:MAG: TonB-dependent receptor [Burkholderiales bacterium]|nr:TonB-dependent receptor [Burkholderiales bacterium]